ncbi:MAG: hypothetical protein Q8K96_07890 [Rubrivivax sp.]|nr:hypothetical protein [Rubrivivax sp.]
MFQHRQQLRRWAARVLLLWLFGVGIGVAHACLTPSLAGLGGELAAMSMDVDAVPHEVAAPQGAHHPGADQPGHHERADGEPASSVKSNCQDFCDKASVSIPPLKAALDDALGHGLPPMAAAAVLPVPAFQPVQWWVPRRDGVAAPPVPIAFLRLTL